VSVCLDKSELRELRRKAQAATLAAVQALGGEARREAIIARALADGGFTPRELAAPAPEGARTQYPRLVEYKLSFALTDLKYVGLFENPEKAVWRLAGAALETPLVATPCFDGFSRADLLNRRSAEGSGSSVLHLHGVPVADVVGDLRELSGSLGQAHALGLHVGEVLSDGASIGPFTKLPGKLA
jgi:hypothetical protein